MNNRVGYDLRQKFFKWDSPAILYIWINVAVFFIAILLNLIGSSMGYGDLFWEQVIYYLTFPSNSLQWPTHFYTLFTYQFFHSDLLHLLFNMIWLYWMGQLLLDFIKPRQFHFIYLLGGAVGAIFFAVYANIPIFKPLPYFALSTAATSVMAIFAALATLVPNYSIKLMIVGNVKVKYLFFVYVALDLIGAEKVGLGIVPTHLGGALFGFIYIKLLQNGTDISAIFKKKPKLKIVKNEKPKQGSNVVNQKEVDIILDKISKSGYDNLSKAEKDILFRASKN
jgi:membrane associated rhomboid family serine protease